MCLIIVFLSFVIEQIARQNRDIERERLQRESDRQVVMEELALASPENQVTTDSIRLQERVQKYADTRRQRTEVFLQSLYNRRDQFLEKLLPVSVPSWWSLWCYPSENTPGAGDCAQKMTSKFFFLHHSGLVCFSKFTVEAGMKVLLCWSKVLSCLWYVRGLCGRMFIFYWTSFHLFVSLKLKFYLTQEFGRETMMWEKLQAKLASFADFWQCGFL